MEVRKHIARVDAPTVLIHWSLVITLLISIATGFRIASDDPNSAWLLTFDAILMQGQVTWWHVAAATTLSLIAATYVVYIAYTGLNGRIILDRARWRNIFSGDFKNRIASFNVLLFWIVFTLLILAGITGALIYWDTELAASASLLSVHKVVAWGIVAYTVFHVCFQLLQGGIRQLLKILTPSAAYGTAFVIAGIVGTATAGTLLAIDKWSVTNLVVPKFDTSGFSLDGDGNDEIWKRTPSVVVNTTRGANESADNAPVTVRAFHDDEYFYGLFEWPDQSRSQKHLPLIKTERGWQVLQHEYNIQDEDDYYEDKFGVMLSTNPTIAASGTAHMGNKPLDNKPSPKGGRGLHYTNDGSIVDVWHWKSVRTGSAYMNQIDDNYFGPPMEPKADNSRYTGGYTQDPNSGGGFKSNWEKFETDIIKPKRLPKDASIIAQYQSINISPGVGDNVTLALKMEDTVPYSEELDTYPVGTIMPSVLVEGPFNGDRGDVSAYSQWKDGKWQLEVKRKLVTDSKFDVAFSKDQPLYMWLAVFDHSQTRHSQHLHPVRVAME